MKKILSFLILYFCSLLFAPLQQGNYGFEAAANLASNTGKHDAFSPCDSKKTIEETDDSLKNLWDDEASKISSVNWEQEEIYPGVYYGYHHFANLFGGPQSISVIDLNMNSAKAEVKFVWTEGRELTSILAQKAGALAAVNGTFFDMEKGGSIEYLKIANSVVDTTSDPNDIRDNGALSISKKKEIRMLKIPSDNSWRTFDTISAYPDIMAAGPVLLDNFMKVPQSVKNTARHPRTLVGLTSDNHLKMITVDGRSPMAEGMSVFELQVLSLALACKDAINFDGGGSTTMWIAGKPNNGVVNYPCDNKIFDHAGERECANIIAIIPRK